MIPESEHCARLADLMDGPWTERATHALKELAMPKAKPTASARVREVARPCQPKLPRAIAAALRPHWERAVKSEDENELRESLDSALEYLQLLELAVETGYLPLEAIQPEAQRIFEAVLWSEPAQEFAKAYDYIGVQYLAKRIGFDLLTTKRMPTRPDDRGAMRFATFLDHHRHWLQDEFIDEWLKFLDDYVEYRGESDEFYEFLEGNQTTAPKRFRRLAEGGRRSIRMLSDLFGTLNDVERPRFGRFYGYWLAKLFAFEYENGSYRRNSKFWDVGDSWAVALTKNAAFDMPTADSEDIRGRMRAVLTNQVQLLDAVWRETRNFVPSRQSR